MNIYFQDLKSKIIKNRTTTIIVLFALLISGITAFNSHGYYHADEHYQIIEYAGIKLGTHKPSDLAWEFSEKIRSSLQPTIAFIIISVLKLLDIKDPYNQVFILRLLTAFFSIYVIQLFANKNKYLLNGKGMHIAFLLMSFFLWFIPFLSVRFSSETLSGLFMLLGVSLYDKEKRSNSILVGIIFGISYLFRFQIVFSLVGFLFWIFIIDKRNWREFFKLGIPFILVVIIGVLIDSWFYGELVFTSWNYFYETMLKKGSISFGDSPWYFYLESIYTLPTKIIGAFILTSFLIMLIFHPKNKLIWMIIPFLIVHSLIPHKEERFIFPIIYFFPLIMMLSFNLIYQIRQNDILKKTYTVLLIFTFLIINGIGLLAMSQKSAGLGRMEISKYIHEHYGNKKINLIYCVWSNPYDPWQGLTAKFYLEKNIESVKIDKLCFLNDSLLLKNSRNLLVIRKYDREYDECKNVLNSKNIKPLVKSVPDWILKLNNKFYNYPDQDVFELYSIIGKCSN
jgi:phosphatidylinositol glycan class B